MHHNITATRRNESYCINDPRLNKPCLMGDPNLCQWDFYSTCLEANPEKAGRPRKPFYDDEPASTPPKTRHMDPPPTVEATPATLPPATPPPPRTEVDQRTINSITYDANDGITQIIEMENAIGCTFEIATLTLKDFIKKENSNSEEFTKLLVKVKERFFSEKGKKAGWKEYIEKTISYHYRQTQTLIKGYSDSIIREYWNELGIAKISLLVRVKQPLSPGLVKALLDKSVSETKKILFPRLTTSKQKASKLDTLINNLKNLKPSELAPQAKTKLKLVLQETLRGLK